MTAFDRAWDLLKSEFGTPYWNYGGSEHTWQDFLDFEVGEKGNFGGDPKWPYFREIEQKYDLTPESRIMWVADDPDVARTYATPWAEDDWEDDEQGLTRLTAGSEYAHLPWKNVEDSWPRGFPMIVDVPLEDMSQFDNRDGRVIEEIDDGDGGTLFLLHDQRGVM